MRASRTIPFLFYVVLFQACIERFIIPNDLKTGPGSDFGAGILHTFYLVLCGMNHMVYNRLLRYQFLRMVGSLWLIRGYILL